MEKELKKKKDGFRLEHWHIVAFGLMIYDALALGISYLIALWLRFDLRFSMIDPPYIEAWRRFLPIYVLFSLAVFTRNTGEAWYNSRYEIKDWGSQA